MSLRHLCSPRLCGSLLSSVLLFAGTFQVHAAEEMLRKAVGKGAYEMAVSQQENALWVATSQSRKTDKAYFHQRGFSRLSTCLRGRKPIKCAIISPPGI